MWERKHVHPVKPTDRVGFRRLKPSEFVSFRLRITAVWAADACPHFYVVYCMLWVCVMTKGGRPTVHVCGFGQKLLARADTRWTTRASCTWRNCCWAAKPWSPSSRAAAAPSATCGRGSAGFRCATRATWCKVWSRAASASRSTRTRTARRAPPPCGCTCASTTTHPRSSARAAARIRQSQVSFIF